MDFLTCFSQRFYPSLPELKETVHRFIYPFLEVSGLYAVGLNLRAKTKEWEQNILLLTDKELIAVLLLFIIPAKSDERIYLKNQLYHVDQQ